MARHLLNLITSRQKCPRRGVQGPAPTTECFATTMKSFNSSDAKFSPDSKVVVFPENPNASDTDYIINITPSYRMSSPSTLIQDTNEQCGANLSDYPNRLPRDDGNFASLQNTVPIPPPSITSLRGNGTLYDTNSVWVSNMFRLLATSQPDAPPNAMIGFEHYEDHYKGTSSKGKCVYKSIAVRYSPSLGLSWTRSVPIITSGTQRALAAVIRSLASATSSRSGTRPTSNGSSLRPSPRSLGWFSTTRWSARGCRTDWIPSQGIRRRGSLARARTCLTPIWLPSRGATPASSATNSMVCITWHGATGAGGSLLVLVLT